ncbi:PAS/PAC sensor hybrid histidine kinase [Melioribacter roseus P3M-2]|uniref:histidine kinase n=1 Tax=Melioribacter roseus (strain DSM 23840 / JCM 17771 / VKM B-2668 / P3M-2) TaxID=1191523 RepID=I7A632_MELRP|nr:PAS domain-containing hybrid sensor histidine kinase/response regulator [Melioribacter roseus]AFN75346.1 PAS/PAC sensor hybrid histidine kinase [Melioribacter roseus P3M-2]
MNNNLSKILELFSSMKSTGNIDSLLFNAFENSFDAIVILNDYSIVYHNKIFAHTFGYNDKDQLINKPFSEFLLDKCVDRFKEKIDGCRNSSGELKNYHARGIKKDYTEFDIEINYKAIPSEDKVFDIIFIRDITEKKKISEQINKLTRIVDQSSSIIIITDLDGRIEYTNPKFTEVTGYFFEEVYGKKTSLLKSGYTADHVYKDLWENILAGREWRGEFKNKKKNGEFYWESVTISPIRNEDGEITNFLAIKEDITEKKEMEFELKRALDSSEEANRLKSTLLSNMSHELRTPLTGIIGFASLLRDDLNNIEQVEMVDKILKSGKRLLITLNSILNLSEIESGAIPINITEFNLGSYTKYFLTNYNKTASEKSLSFDIKVLDNNINAVADENLFKQILMHIVDNAIKFTQKGGVTIEVDTKNGPNNQTLAVIRVIDTGIGIAKNDQEKIFREFRQISEGIRRNFEGSGLGLAVAKKMANLMNGDISVESELGKGSTFTITLPGTFNGKEQKPTEKESRVPNKDEIIHTGENKPRILSIEDNILNAELVSLYLKDVCEVDTAFDYYEAVEKLKHGNYTAILVDINLGSGPSGIDFAREVRKNPGYNYLPLIAITGYALLRDEKKLLKEGFDYYIAKPYEQEDLLEIIHTVIKKQI